MVNLGNFSTSWDLRLFFVGYGAIDQHICEEIGLWEFSSRSCTEMPCIISYDLKIIEQLMVMVNHR